MRKTTFTKKIIALILIIALIDIQLPFVMAFMQKEQIAEELGKAIVVEIIGVVLVYCCKSYFETKEEEKNKIEKMKMKEDKDDPEDII